MNKEINDIADSTGEKDIEDSGSLDKMVVVEEKEEQGNGYGQFKDETGNEKHEDEEYEDGENVNEAGVNGEQENNECVSEGVVNRENGNEGHEIEEAETEDYVGEGAGDEACEGERPGDEEYGSEGAGAEECESEGPGDEEYGSEGAGAEECESEGPGDEECESEGAGAEACESEGPGDEECEREGTGAEECESEGPGDEEYEGEESGDTRYMKEGAGNKGYANEEPDSEWYESKGEESEGEESEGDENEWYKHKEPENEMFENKEYMHKGYMYEENLNELYENKRHLSRTYKSEEQMLEEYKRQQDEFDRTPIGDQCGEPDCYYEGCAEWCDAGQELRKGCSRKRQTCRKEKVLLKCSKPSTVTVPIATETGTTFTAASLDVDTSQFCNPCLQFEFASNIVTCAAVLNIDFQIFKQCEDQVSPTAVSPVWRYSSILPETSSNTFSFSVCKCNECREKCCNYSVRIRIMGVATVGTATIKNMTLSVFAVDRKCD